MLTVRIGLARLLGVASLLSSAAAFAVPAIGEQSMYAPPEALSDIAHLSSASVCDAAPQPGFARCHARVVLGVDGEKFNSSDPHGYYPADIASAYNIPAGGGAGMTIAIVDAFDKPNAEADLAVYRKQFNLPPCTSENGCFRKVNQDGLASPLPAADDGWSQEITLDLAAVSAACPACNILLIEANDSNLGNLGTGVNSAVRLGATAVSNSYGGDEGAGDLSLDSEFFNHPGVLITASTGDNGYGVSYPASSANVVAVGGTSLLHFYSSRGWTETAWINGGSGCSSVTPKPSYQHDVNCKYRTVADISALGDPLTGLAIYDSYGTGKGWEVYGGTSLSSPLVASIFASVGAAGVAGDFPYAHASAFYDVTVGINGWCFNDLCMAFSGYDGPTGMGTPNATAILGIISGSGNTGGGGSAHCSEGSVNVAGICVPEVGCQSSGSSGLVDWIACSGLAAFALLRQRSRGASKV